MYNQSNEEKAFADDLDAIRTRFNNFAIGNDIPQLLSELIVNESAAAEFNYIPYAAHGAVDVADLYFKGKYNLAILHNIIDFGADLYDHNQKAALAQQHDDLSERFVKSIRAAVEGPNSPTNYTQALAKQTFLAKIRPDQFSKQYYEDFKNIQYQATTEVSKFSNQKTSDALRSMELTNQQVLRYFAELARITGGSSEQYKNILLSMASKEQLARLTERLQQQGITVNEQLANIISQSDITSDALNKILFYLESEHDAKLKQQQQNIKMAQYHGLVDGCDFLSQLAQFTASRELGAVATIIRSGTQIRHACGQIATAASLGLAVLSPVSAIGIAALNIFSLFRRQPNYNQLILKNLHLLSKQIGEFRNEMKESLQKIDRRVSMLLTRVQIGFENIYFSLEVSLTRQLSDIKGDIETLCEITKSSFEELSLRDLKMIFGLVFDLKKKITGVELDNLSYVNYLRTLRDSYILHQSRLFTGEIYMPLLKYGSGHTTRLIQLFRECNTDKIQNLLGLLLLYAREISLQQHEILPGFNSFHPEIWYFALSSYLQLVRIFNKKFPYDETNVNIDLFYQQGNSMLSFLRYLQTSNKLYIELLRRISNLSRQLGSKYHKIMENSGLDLNNDLDTQITQFSSCKPQKIDYQPPKTCKDSVKFMEGVAKTPLANPEMTLQQLKNQPIPLEFIMAEHLQLGHFIYKLHLDTPICHRHDHWRLEPVGKVGFEINFVQNNQVIAIYKPTTPEHSKVKETNDFYYTLIGKYTQRVDDFTDSCLRIRSAITHELLSRKKKLCQNIAATLVAEPAYHEMIKCSLFLLAYMRLAGFPKLFIAEVENKLQVTDIIVEHEYFISHAKPDINMLIPVLKVLSANDTSNIQRQIDENLKLMQQDGVQSNIVHATVHKGLSILQEHAICDDSQYLQNIANSPKMTPKSQESCNAMFFRSVT